MPVPVNKFVCLCIHLFINAKKQGQTVGQMESLHIFLWQAVIGVLAKGEK